MDWVDRLIELEADVRYQELAAPDEPEFRCDTGTRPVLLSAPHGAVHTRHGRDKEEDDYTAGLARLVAELTGAHACYARRKSLTDPNWYPRTPYKARLAEIISRTRVRFVLDLHGAAASRPFGLALGTLMGQSCPELRPAILSALGDAGFRPDGPGMARLDVDLAFPANGKHGQETVTRYCWAALRVPAAQLEINERLRVARARSDASGPQLHLASAEDIMLTVRALVAVVEVVSSNAE